MFPPPMVVLALVYMAPVSLGTLIVNMSYPAPGCALSLIVTLNVAPGVPFASPVPVIVVCQLTASLTTVPIVVLVKVKLVVLWSL